MKNFFPSEPYQYDCIPLCLTADPNTHEIYGVFYDEDGMGIEFGTISYDEDEFSRTVISSLDISDGVWNSIAVSGDGTFYGIRMNQDGMGVTRSADLCTISRETGEVNVIGETGALPQYISDAIIDPNTDRMFWTVSPPTAQAGSMRWTLPQARLRRSTSFPTARRWWTLSYLHRHQPQGPGRA